MNFQTSKRIMCCLMAALILCCAVVRPIEASATGLGAVAVGKVVGFALEPAISSILVALGVVGTTAAFTELVENISKNVPAEYIITALDGAEYLSAVNYNDITYVAQELVEWVKDCIWGNTATITRSYTKGFPDVVEVTGDSVGFEYVYSKATEYSSIAPFNDYIMQADTCTTYLFNSDASARGMYVFGGDVQDIVYHGAININGANYDSAIEFFVPPGVVAAWYDTGWKSVKRATNSTVFIPNATKYKVASTVASGVIETVTEGLSHTDVFHSTLPDYETWVFPGIHIIILPEDPAPSEPTEPEETEPPESEPPESQPAVPPTPSEPTPSEPEPDVTDPVEIPDTDPSTPSDPEPEETTPEVTEPVEFPDPNKYETYIPITFPNTILDPNEVTQPEVQTGNGSTQPEIETGNEVEIEDPNRTETEEPTNPDDDTELGDPVVWPDFPSVDTPEVPFPGYDNDYTGEENDTSWLTKIGEWIKWLGELIKEWIKWLGEYIVEWLKWLGEIIQLLPDAIAYYLKLMVQWLVEAFKPLFQKLAEWLQPLMDYLLEGLKKLFVPKDGYFDEKINELRQSFPLFDSILALLFDLKSFLLSLGATPPVIYANLSSADGSIYWGPNTVFVDMSWYAAYKPAMDSVLSGLLWLWFAWRMVLNLPGIMNGVSGVWKNPIAFTKTSSKEG